LFFERIIPDLIVLTPAAQLANTPTNSLYHIDNTSCLRQQSWSRVRRPRALSLLQPLCDPLRPLRHHKSHSSSSNSSSNHRPPRSTPLEPGVTQTWTPSTVARMPRLLLQTTSTPS